MNFIKYYSISLIAIITSILMLSNSANAGWINPLANGSFETQGGGGASDAASWGGDEDRSDYDPHSGSYHMALDSGDSIYQFVTSFNSNDLSYFRVYYQGGNIKLRIHWATDFSEWICDDNPSSYIACTYNNGWSPDKTIIKVSIYSSSNSVEVDLASLLVWDSGGGGPE